MDTCDMKNETGAERQHAGEDISILDLPISVRAKNALIRAGHRVASELVSLGYNDLMAMANMGKKTAQEVLDYVRHQGIADEQPAARVDSDISIQDLPVSLKTKCILFNAGYQFVSEVIALGLDGVPAVRAIEADSVSEIRDFLKHLSIDGAPSDSALDGANMIRRLPLSVRAKNSLAKAGYDCVEELYGLDYDTLMSMDSMGDKTANEVLDYIRLHPVPEALPNTRIAGDCEVLDFPLSVRAQNALSKAGIRFASEAMALGYEGLMKLGSMGEKTAGEVWNAVKRLSIVNDMEEGSPEPGPEEALAAELQQAYGKNVGYWKRELITVCGVSADMSEAQRLSCLYDRKAIRSLVKSVLLKYLEAHEGRVSRADLSRAFTERLLPSSVAEELLTELETSKDITFARTDVCRNYPSVCQFVAGIDKDQTREMMQHLLLGKTLEQVGNRFGTSRQNVCQIRDRVLQGRPRLREDRYLDLFNQYLFTPETFRSVFGESVEAYYYLSLVSKTKKDSRKPLSELYEDDAVSPELKARLEPVFRKDRLLDQDVWVKRNVKDMVRHYVKTFCRDLTADADFMSGYHQWLKSLKLAKASEFILKPRYADNLDRFDFVVRNIGHRFRYYNWADYDFNALLATLQIEQYENTEISALKLYTEHSELMQQYDIRDEYELHDILKRVWPADNNHVKFGRSPTIIIGEANRREQVLSVLRRYGPLRIEDLATRYEEIYGVKAATVLANYCTGLEVYRHDGLYSVDSTVHPEQ